MIQNLTQEYGQMKHSINQLLSSTLVTFTTVQFQPMSEKTTKSMQFSWVELGEANRKLNHKIIFIIVNRSKVTMG